MDWDSLTNILTASFPSNQCIRSIPGHSWDLKPKGVRALHELGQRLQINDLKIRIIVVVFENDRVTYTVAKELLGS